MTDPYQLRSWCDPHGRGGNLGLIGQIHFPVNRTDLDRQDRLEIQKLERPYSMVLLGKRTHFLCIGHADHRGSISYNDRLARERAERVRGQLHAMFGHMRHFSASPAVSRGELDSGFPLPSRDHMASDRRVDIYSDRLANRPAMRLPPVNIQGRLPPRIRITLVRGEGADALRRSAPGLPDDGSSPRGTWVEVIPELLQSANKDAVERQIRAGLEEIRPSVAWRLMDHATGGILIVAHIDVTERYGQTAGLVVSVTEHTGVFGHPQHAIAHWRRQSRYEQGPVAPPPYGRIEYLFYWATRG